MHLAVLVVDGDILLHAVSHSLVVDNDLARFTSERIDNYLQDIQQFPGIATAVAEDCLRLFQLDILFFKKDIFLQSPIQKGLQVIHFQRLEHKYLATGQKGSDHLKGGILCRRSNQDNRAILHGSKQGVLLRLAESVDLVYEQDGGGALGEHRAAFSAFNNIPHILHTGADGRQGVEVPLEG